MNDAQAQAIMAEAQAYVKRAQERIEAIRVEVAAELMALTDRLIDASGQSLTAAERILLLSL
jgi:hypothetical protein